MLGLQRANIPRLTNGEIIYEEFWPMWSQSTNVTDRQTDDIDCDPKTALYTKVHRAVKSVSNKAFGRNSTTGLLMHPTRIKARINPFSPFSPESEMPQTDGVGQLWKLVTLTPSFFELEYTDLGLKLKMCGDILFCLKSSLCELFPFQGQQLGGAKNYVTPQKAWNLR